MEEGGSATSRAYSWAVNLRADNDAVVNLGISCLYSKDALQDKDYEAVFKTLKINKAFESSFLKPRGR